MSSLQQVTARHTGGTAGCIPCIQQNERDRIFYLCICCCSVAQWCPTLCHSMNCSTPGFLVLHYLPEFAQTQVRESVMPSNHLIFCHFLLLLPSIFPSIRVFSSESALSIGWSESTTKTVWSGLTLIGSFCYCVWTGHSHEITIFLLTRKQTCSENEACSSSRHIVSNPDAHSHWTGAPFDPKSESPRCSQSGAGEAGVHGWSPCSG